MAELKDLDEAFDTLSLVNEPDMDVYLKVIMSVDEKTAQNIRGELNHMMIKYIDADPILKGKLALNSYDKYNPDYLTKTYRKLQDMRLTTFVGNIRNSIMNIMSKSNTMSAAFQILFQYLYGLDGLDNYQLTDHESKINKAFIAACSICSSFDLDIIRMHNNICNTVQLLNNKLDSKVRPITALKCQALVNGETLIGFVCRFTIAVPEARHIPVRLYMGDFPDDVVPRIVKYFNESRAELDSQPFKLEDTLAYIAKHRSDDCEN